MNEDYLWDGTGEPDPEVRQLEETLRGWRCARREPPPLPQRELNSNVFGRRSFAPHWLAVAAAVALLMMAAIGLRTLRINSRQDVSAAKSSVASQQIDALPPPPAPPPAGEVAQVNKPLSKDQRLVAAARRPRKQMSTRSQLARAAERERGTIAKERLILALRIASSELRDVHKTVSANFKPETNRN